MKKTILTFLIFSSPLTFAANLLSYERVLNLNDFKGQSFLSLVQEQIKPQLDTLAENGASLCSAEVIKNNLSLVDKKVSNKFRRAIESPETLNVALDVQDEKPITFYDLPQHFAAHGLRGGRYDLATIVPLLCGGGVAVVLNENNTNYHVNYGTGKTLKDEMTGRSFGESNSRLALDASDAHYLKLLENYLRQYPDNATNFYETTFQVLLNSDPASLSSINEEGQIVFSDFLAVYTAEQDRHLMSDFKKHPWEVALLEVTLLGALHSGQDQVSLFQNGKFTNTTIKQHSGCEVQTETQKASMVDYWQFSKNPDPQSCRRSGINITRSDFRKLGKAITQYYKSRKPELLEKIQIHLPQGSRHDNVFQQMTEYLASAQAPKKFGSRSKDLTRAYVQFLMNVQKDANLITTELRRGDNP